MHNRGEFFREDEEWYISLLMETLELIKESGCVVEVNTRGLYKKRSDSLFPGVKVIREMCDRTAHRHRRKAAHRTQ